MHPLKRTRLLLAARRQADSLCDAVELRLDSIAASLAFPVRLPPKAPKVSAPEGGYPSLGPLKAALIRSFTSPGYVYSTALSGSGTYCLVKLCQSPRLSVGVTFDIGSYHSRVSVYWCARLFLSDNDYWPHALPVCLNTQGDSSVPALNPWLWRASARNASVFVDHLDIAVLPKLEALYASALPEEPPNPSLQRTRYARR